MNRRSTLAALCALLALLGPARAQTAKVGKFDAARVFREFQLFRQFEEERQGMQTRAQQQLVERRDKFPYLLDEEWNRMLELRAKGDGLTPAERDELASLTGLSDSRDRELSELEAPGTRTEEQRARFRALTALKRSAEDGMRAMLTRLTEEIKKREAEMDAQVTAMMEAAIEKVAKAQALDLVLVADVVLYGGVDVTDAVLAALNEAAAGAAAPPAGGTP